MLKKKIAMPMTNLFLSNCLSKKVFDKVENIFNGYEITKGDKTVYVRLNEQGSALISSGKELKEVLSSRLDNVLHRFLLSEFLPLLKTEINGKKVYSTFVPVKKDDKIAFVDSSKNTYKIANASNETAMAIYKECLKNNADSALFALQNFVASSVKDEGAELDRDVITSSFDMKDFAVTPCASFIQDAGKTVVGEFVTSCADKDALVRFENRLVGEKAAIASSKKESKKPQELFSSMVEKADSATLCLENSKELKVVLNKNGVFSAVFKAVPNLEIIQNALYREGLTVGDLESDFTFDIDNAALKSIFNSVQSVTSVEEKPVAGVNQVSHLIGSAVTNTLASYGIDDQMKVFDKLTKIEIA